MKTPYAKKWQQEIDNLRKIALGCDLTEELKWGKPCFTCRKKNVAIIIPLKDACALSFFKGALLKDPKHILKKIGEHTQAGRWIRSPDAGTEEVVHLSRLEREAGEDAGSAGGKVCATDLKRPGVQRVHRLSPLARGIYARGEHSHGPAKAVLQRLELTLAIYRAQTR